MNRDEVESRINQWQRTQKEALAQIDAFTDVVGFSDGPFVAALYAILAAHTGAVSELIGDKEEWLGWWENECEFGKRHLLAEINGTLKPVRTVKQLAKLICS